jgi:hypothetical protein
VGQAFETEIEGAVEFVEGNAHVETDFGGGQTGAPGLLHDGEAVEVEPTDGVWVDGPNDAAFGSFQPGAERGDTIFDEIEAGTLHDVVFIVIGGGDDFFGDPESGADFGSGKFAVLDELEIGAGDRGFDDFTTVPEQERAIGGAATVFAISQSGQELFFLGVIEVVVGAHDDAHVGVVFDEATHVSGGGVIGFHGELGGSERGKTAPEVVGIGEFFMPHFLGEEDLGFLLAAYEYITKEYPNLDSKSRRFLNEKAIHGTDLVPPVARLCAMNLYLHGIGGGDKTPVEIGDSLLTKPAEVDMVLTNPPFGKKSSFTVISDDGNPKEVRNGES